MKRLIAVLAILGCGDSTAAKAFEARGEFVLDSANGSPTAGPFEAHSHWNGVDQCDSIAFDVLTFYTTPVRGVDLVTVDDNLQWRPCAPGGIISRDVSEFLLPRGPTGAEMPLFMESLFFYTVNDTVSVEYRPALDDIVITDTRDSAKFTRLHYSRAP